MAEKKLDTQNHDRDVMGMTYVYPVVSRRAGGVSIGVNLNPNNACNWRCAYCQVPDLVRGSAPAIDLNQLQCELESMLKDVMHGSFMQEHVAPVSRRLSDVAISGNGEPTSCRKFHEIVSLITSVMQRFGLFNAGNNDVKLRLITNGSYLHKPDVQQGLALMGVSNGEVWVKVDSATAAGIKRINGVTATPELLFRQVGESAELCPTWIQTCMFSWDGIAPDDHELNAYLDFIQRLKNANVPIKGVLLYGLARPSLQPEAEHLGKLPPEWMKMMVDKIEITGIPVQLSI